MLQVRIDCKYVFGGISDFPKKINKGVKQSMSTDLWVTTNSSTSRLFYNSP